MCEAPIYRTQMQQPSRDEDPTREVDYTPNFLQIFQSAQTNSPTTTATTNNNINSTTSQPRALANSNAPRRGRPRKNPQPSSLINQPIEPSHFATIDLPESPSLPQAQSTHSPHTYSPPVNTAPNSNMLNQPRMAQAGLQQRLSPHDSQTNQLLSSLLENQACNLQFNQDVTQPMFAMISPPENQFVAGPPAQQSLAIAQTNIYYQQHQQQPALRQQVQQYQQPQQPQQPLNQNSNAIYQTHQVHRANQHNQPTYARQPEHMYAVQPMQISSQELHEQQLQNQQLQNQQLQNQSQYQHQQQRMLNYTTTSRPYTQSAINTTYVPPRQAVSYPSQQSSNQPAQSYYANNFVRNSLAVRVQNQRNVPRLNFHPTPLMQRLSPTEPNVRLRPISSVDNISSINQISRPALNQSRQQAPRASEIVRNTSAITGNRDEPASTRPARTLDVSMPHTAALLVSAITTTAPRQITPIPGITTDIQSPSAPAVPSPICANSPPAQSGPVATVALTPVVSVSSTTTRAHPVPEYRSLHVQTSPPPQVETLNAACQVTERRLERYLSGAPKLHDALKLDNASKPDNTPVPTKPSVELADAQCQTDEQSKPEAGAKVQRQFVDRATSPHIKCHASVRVKYTPKRRKVFQSSDEESEEEMIDVG